MTSLVRASRLQTDSGPSQSGAPAQPRTRRQLQPAHWEHHQITYILRFELQIPELWEIRFETSSLSYKIFFPPDKWCVKMFGKISSMICAGDKSSEWRAHFAPILWCITTVCAHSYARCSPGQKRCQLIEPIFLYQSGTLNGATIPSYTNKANLQNLSNPKTASFTSLDVDWQLYYWWHLATFK